MPQQIPIQAIPNQEFTVSLNNNSWDITLKTTAGQISASLSLNNTVILSNARCVSGMRIIPSQYEENGNFIFSTQNFQLPNYEQFNLTQFLLYFSAAELAAIRVLTPQPITAAYFNQIAALPLRFSPQGYLPA